MPELTLYNLRYCPYCIKVRRVAEQLGIPLTIVDVDRDPAARARLFRARGRGTVPVLGIPSPDGEVLLPESDDIVDYLRSYAQTRVA